MPSHFEVRDLPHNINQLFNLVADVEKYPEFLPWCSAARILKREENKVYAELAISYKGFSESYVSVVTLNPPAEHLDEATIDVNLEKGPFKKLKNYWVFRKLDENKTQIEFFVEFEFKSMLIEKLVGSLFEKATHKMVQAFEDRAASQV